VTGGLMVVVSRRTLRLPWAPTVALAIVSLMLLASPVQTQNLLWGIQVIVYFPGLCLMSCAAIATTMWPFQRKIVAQAFLSLAATYSYANGMTLWAIVPLLWLSEIRQVPARVRWGVTAAWLAAATLALRLYFSHYVGPDTSGNLLAVMAQPGRALGSLVLLVGAQLSAGVDRHLQAAVSAVALAGAAAAALWRLRSYKDIDRALPWVALLAYGAVASCLIVLGRFRFGVTYPMLGDRYGAFTAYLYVAVFHLVALASTGPSFGRWLRRAAWAAVAVAVLLHGRAVLVALPKYADITVERLQSKAAVWLVRAVPLGDGLPRITQYYADQGHVAAIAATLSRAGMIHPPPILTLSRGIHDTTGNSRFGALEIATPIRAGRVRVSGWCVLPDRGEPCDAVVVTPAGSGGVDRPCAVLFPSEPRIAVLREIGLRGLADNARTARIGWSAEIDCGATDGIDAWAVDIRRAELNRLARQ